MGRGRKNKKILLKRKRLERKRKGKLVYFTLSNCPKKLKGKSYSYQYKNNVHRCNFNDSIFKNIRYRSGHITNSNFRNAKLENVDYVSVNLKKNRYTNADLNKVLFFACDLTGVDFKNTNFKDVYFISCKMNDIKNLNKTNTTYIINNLNYKEDISLTDVVKEMEGNSKLEKYKILITSTGTVNKWILSILQTYYSSNELVYFFNKLLNDNKMQFYTMHDYLKSLKKFYRK